ncbi:MULTISPECIES: hypothetical protein [Clostridium]|uniref:hypothetical protein n=1 Tax=Clostridium TaxID=1485 RepID=UPI000823FDFA|nr:MULTISPECIES: hypothetical protein [Clostridium]PJI08335.1 alpha/beta hydrolase [Clostridium sp. CT7]
MNNEIIKSLKYEDMYGEFYSDKNSKSLTITFPGINYDHNKPLLYYARKVALQNCNDVLCINYKNVISWGDIGAKKIEDVSIEIADIINRSIRREYDCIYFVGKSVGTEIAGCTSEKLKLNNIKFFYLTPIDETLKYIIDRECTVISGTSDEFLKRECVDEIKKNSNVNLMLFEKANHSLEIKDNIIRSLKILERVVEEYIDFLK